MGEEPNHGCPCSPLGSDSERVQLHSESASSGLPEDAVLQPGAVLLRRSIGSRADEDVSAQLATSRLSGGSLCETEDGSNMRLFISFAQRDAELAAQLEAALRRHNIQVWSRLDVPSAEEWNRLVDRESAQADGFVFLLGAGFSANPQLQAEWRAFLRNDWDSTKPLVPVIAAHGIASKDLPPFLRHRKAICTTNFDAVIDDLQYLVQHPAEALDHTHDEQTRAEQKERLREIQDYALALKEEGSGGEAKP